MSGPLDYVPTHSAIFHPRARAFNPVALSVSIIIGLAFVIAASWFYIWFYEEYNDVFARLAACAGMSLGLWFLCVIVCEFGEVSRARVAIIVSLALSLVALYFSWIFWMQRTLTVSLGQRVPVWPLILRPIPVAQLIWDLHDFGAWKYKNVYVRGWPLLVIWIVEAMVFTVPPTFLVTRMVTRRTPRCQACRKHVERDGDLLKFSSRDEPGFISAVLDRDFDRLLDFERSDEELEDDNSPRIVLKLYRCPSCDDTHLLHAESVSDLATRSGKPKRVELPLIEYMVIGGEQAEYLKQLQRQVSADSQAEYEETIDAGAEPSSPDETDDRLPN